MFKFVAVVAVSLLAMGSAQAADLIINEPIAQVAFTDAGFDWTGFYAGLNGAYASGQATAVGSVTGVTTSPSISGGLIGGTVGYNAQFDSFVLGVEGDVAWSGVTGSTACSANPIYDCRGTLDWLSTIKARAGFAVDSVLFFGTAGLAAGGTTTTVTPAAPGLTNNFSGVMTGWTVGAGVELAVTEAISIKAEYAYVDLGNLEAPAGTLSGGEATNLSAINHLAKVGVNFHF